MKLPTNTSFDEALHNAVEFNKLTPESESQALSNFGTFSDWYYFPTHDIFGPNKFIGFSGLTLNNYKGGEEGYNKFGINSGRSKQALEEWFRKLNPDTAEFQDLRNKLESFAGGLGKRISQKTFRGSGGIYVPKPGVSSNAGQRGQVAPSVSTYENAERTSLSSRIILDEGDESAFPEGKARFRLHRSLERDNNITKKAKIRRLEETGKLKCEACEFDFAKVYGDLGEGFIEGHHTIPVADLDGTSKTKVSDIALLCSNCHRMIHRGSHLTVAGLRNLLRRLRSEADEAR